MPLALHPFRPFPPVGPPTVGESAAISLSLPIQAYSNQLV